MVRKTPGPVLATLRVLLGSWVGEAWESIIDDSLRSACAAAYFPPGLKLSQLEEVESFNSPQPNPAGASDSDSDSNLGTASDSDSDSDFDSGTDSDYDGTADEGSDSDSDQVDILWAKANRGIWGLAQVFDKKLYLTRDLAAADFVPKDLKLLKPALEPESPKQPTARVTRNTQKEEGR